MSSSMSFESIPEENARLRPNMAAAIRIDPPPLLLLLSRSPPLLPLISRSRSSPPPLLLRLPSTATATVSALPLLLLSRLCSSPSSSSFSGMT